jgi:hypothetical protein
MLLDWNYLQSPRPPAFADFDHISDPEVFLRYKQLVYDFVFKVVTYYRGTISAYITQWEINWPGHAVFESRLAERIPWTVEQAVELDKIVSKAIRDADPDAIVMLGTSSPFGGWTPYDADPFEFAESCLKAGVDVDMVAFEFYPSEGSPADFHEYVRKLAKLGKPIFIEETGYPSEKPDAEESWLKGWKWQAFDEHTQALWFRYVFTLAFGMCGVSGVGIVSMRDMQATASHHRWTNSFGLFTTTWQPKESATTLRELIADFTTSGTARTDIKGAVSVRGFAGDYSVHVSGYEPVTIHISEGTTEELTVSLSRERTSEYDDAAKTVESAKVALSALRSRDLKTQEAKNLTEAAAAEYELAVASLHRWELDAAQTHAERSRQLADQALQAETQYQQQQDYLKFSAVLAAIAVIIAVMVVSLVRSRTTPKPRREDDAGSRFDGELVPS